MTRSSATRLATIGVLIAALGLSACGRKGPLEAPPASYAGAGQTLPSGEPVPVGQAVTAMQGDGGGPVPPPTTTAVPRKPFFLDFLLN